MDKKEKEDISSSLDLIAILAVFAVVLILFIIFVPEIMNLIEKSDSHVE